MKTIATALIISIVSASVIATTAEAGPKGGAGFLGVSGLDLGSGR